MPILNKQRRDELVRIATNEICQNEAELINIKTRLEIKILNFLGRTNEEFSYTEPEILTKPIEPDI